jgi:hypothetical protein
MSWLQKRPLVDKHGNWLCTCHHYRCGKWGGKYIPRTTRIGHLKKDAEFAAAVELSRTGVEREEGSPDGRREAPAVNLHIDAANEPGREPFQGGASQSQEREAREEQFGGWDDEGVLPDFEDARGAREARRVGGRGQFGGCDDEEVLPEFEDLEDAIAGAGSEVSAFSAFDLKLVDPVADLYKYAGRSGFSNNDLSWLLQWSFGSKGSVAAAVDPEWQERARESRAPTSDHQVCAYVCLIAHEFAACIM